jgi:hypothetical protein
MARKRRSRSGWTSTEIFVFAAFLLVLLVPGSLLALRAYASHRLLVPLSLFALIAGIMYEYRRVAEKWSTVLWAALGAFAASFLAFLPGKHERNYILEDHIQMWPYAFCGALILIAIIGHKDRVTIRLHEGLTFLHTIALVYWIIDMGIAREPGPWTMGLLILLGFFSLLSILHAFLPLTHSRPSRLWLSLWSSGIMLLLAIDNIRRVYGLGYIEHAQDWQTISLIIGNYFLLGISSIYMAQNAMMLVGFLPGRGTFFNKQYFKEIDELKKDHIKRFSDEQESFSTVLLCALFAIAVFGSNMHYQLVRSNFAIWLVFLTFPWLLGLLNALFTRSRSPLRS